MTNYTIENLLSKITELETINAELKVEVLRLRLTRLEQAAQLNALQRNMTLERNTKARERFNVKVAALLNNPIYNKRS